MPTISCFLTLRGTFIFMNIRKYPIRSHRLKNMGKLKYGPGGNAGFPTPYDKLADYRQASCSYLFLDGIIRPLGGASNNCITIQGGLSHHYGRDFGLRSVHRDRIEGNPAKLPSGILHLSEIEKPAASITWWRRPAGRSSSKHLILEAFSMDSAALFKSILFN
jgi:hypothetical protein